YVLEALPIEDRQTVWEQVEPEIAGRVFVEVSSTVRESLIDATPRDALVRMLSTLDLGDLGYVSELLPEEVLNEVSRALESSDRAVFEASIQYGEETVGHYMTREFVAVPDTYTVQQTLEDLRRRGELPPQTDRIFVVDARHILRGALSLQALLLRDPAAPMATSAGEDTVAFSAHDNAGDAVKAFERYDLVSAPVVDDRGKLIGRLTVDAAM